MTARITSIPTYFIYNEKTGAILGTYSSFSIEHEAYTECDEAVLLKQTLDDGDLLDLVDAPDDIKVIRADLREDADIDTDFVVDVGKGELVQRNQISLSADKIELTGDGKDEATITLRVERPNGRKTQFDGPVHVRTSRGKLSVRAGAVDVKKGTATFTLTSVPETIDRVTLTARCEQNTLSAGDLQLAFV